jgi:hypothetical protein
MGQVTGRMKEVGRHDGLVLRSLDDVDDVALRPPLLGGLIAFGVWAVRRFTERRAAGGARQILEERFARGEIDDEEFQRRLQTLGRS